MSWWWSTRQGAKYSLVHVDLKDYPENITGEGGGGVGVGRLLSHPYLAQSLEGRGGGRDWGSVSSRSSAMSVLQVLLFQPIPLLLCSVPTVAQVSEWLIISVSVFSLEELLKKIIAAFEGFIFHSLTPHPHSIWFTHNQPTIHTLCSGSVYHEDWYVIRMGKPWYGPFSIFHFFTNKIDFFNGPFSKFNIAAIVVNGPFFWWMGQWPMAPQLPNYWYIIRLSLANTNSQHCILYTHRQYRHQGGSEGAWQISTWHSEWMMSAGYFYFIFFRCHSWWHMRSDKPYPLHCPLRLCFPCIYPRSIYHEAWYDGQYIIRLCLDHHIVNVLFLSHLCFHI